jgi:DNA-binding Lrp family transcriptional regulator
MQPRNAIQARVVHEQANLRRISTFARLNIVETGSLDEIDRQIIHLLTLRPRSSFRTIGDVVGISDQTAARRYRRLRESAGLRVRGLVHGERAGWVDWMVRLQTTPGSANAIADVLARRPDTRWVRLYSGGTEIACVLQARTAEQRNTLFLRGLPGSRRVVQISAHAALHTFSPVEWVGMANALSAAQLAKLDESTANREANREATRAGAVEHPVSLQPADDLLLAELARDGRTSNAALAAATHWHESTVRRRIAELAETGFLYFDVDVDDSVLGIGVSVMLWLSVEPARLDEVGRTLAGHPEIPFVAAMTGASNLVASAVFGDTQQLYEYLTGPLARLPGVRSLETMPIIGTLKRSGVLAGPG